MELSEYAILKLHEARIADAERAIARRRTRVKDDPVPSGSRDARWAAAIHRWATKPAAPRVATPSATPTGRTASGQATLGCAQA